MSTIRNALKEGLDRDEFVITAEYCLPPRGESLATLEALADYVRDDDRVHAIALTDRVTSETDYDPIEPATRVMERSAKVPMVHLSGKGHTPDSMRERLKRCRQLGLQNVLPITGDMPRAPETSAGGAPEPSQAGHAKAEPETSYVDSVQALALARQVDEELFLAAATSTFKYTEAQAIGQYMKMHRKLRHGARVIFNQVGYDLRKTEELVLYSQRIDHAIDAIAALYWLTPGFARFANAEHVPGVIISTDLCDRIAEVCKQPDGGRQARTDMMAAHILLCKAFGYRGVHVGGLKKADTFKRILDHVTQLDREGLDLDALWQRWCGHLRFESGRPVQCGPPDGFYLFAEDERGLNGCECTVLTEEVGPGLKYRMLRKVHDIVFDRGLRPGGLGERLLRALAVLPTFPEIGYGLERIIKSPLVGCQGCGSCSLPETEYVCVEGNCAKKLLNGPCGGSGLQGQCEVRPERECAWIEVYRRAKQEGHLTALEDGHLLAKDRRLQGSCSWINLALGLDHHGEEHRR